MRYVPVLLTRGFAKDNKERKKLTTDAASSCQLRSKPSFAIFAVGCRCVPMLLASKANPHTVTESLLQSHQASRQVCRDPLPVYLSLHRHSMIDQSTGESWGTRSSLPSGILVAAVQFHERVLWHLIQGLSACL